MTIRLEYAKKIYGLLSVSLPGDAHFDPEEQTLFSELAEDISFALHAIETERDRQKKAATLEEKARQLELLVLEHSSGLWEWDVNEGRVVMNSAYETMLGYSPGEMGQSLEDWKRQIHPDDQAGVIEMLRKVLSGTNNEDIYKIEFRMLKKEGTWLPLRGRGFVVRRDKNGRAAKMVGIHTPAG
jgi:PAS domain S-box-containing protein